METPIPAVAGGGNLALDSRSSMVEQEEAGEDGGHVASKIQAPASARLGCAGVDMALPSELAPEELSDQEADQQRSKHTTSRSLNVKKSLLVKRKSSAVNAPKPPTEKRRKSSASNVQFVRSPILNRILASPRMRHSRAKHQRSLYAGLSSSTLPDDTRTTASPNFGRDSSRTVERHKSISRALGRRSTAVEEDEIGEDEGDEASKFQALTSGRDRIRMETLSFEAVPEDVGQQRSMQHQGGKDAASRSVDRIKSLLSKRKSHVVNASNHSAGMQRKSSASHVHFVRSPVLNRMLQSPKMSQSPVLSARSSSSSSFDDTRMTISPDLGPDASRPIKRRKLRSDVWKEFEPIYEGNLVVQAKCIHCLELLSATRDNGRSACRRHLKVCKERTRMNQLVESMNTGLSPDSLALKNWKFDQEVSRKAMVNFIVLQELPFSLVDHAPFQKFIATLNPWFTIVSRTTVAEDIMSSYEDKRLALRETIKKSNSRVCLTADLWTSNQNLGYLCITCHFIDNDWMLQKRIIGFGLVASPHDGFTLFNALLKCLQEWKLEHKLFSITLDNAKNNNNMVGSLRKNLSERHLMLGNGDLLHMRCVAHVLNLIVKEGFKVIDGATNRIRDSVKYIRSSQARKQRFEEIIVQLGISCEKRPSLDVPTRWNSTYLMLKSAIEYRAVFDVMESQDPNYMDKPSNIDWNMADLLCNVFKPFYDATNVVSGTLYPTANHCFHVLWEVKGKIETLESHTDISIAVMASKMKLKFEKYWNICLLQICVPVVLDPRFKFSFISFRLNAGFGDKGPAYTEMVKATMENLFSAYSAMAPDLSYSQPESNDGSIDEYDCWADFEQHLAAQKRKRVKSELDTYLQDDLFPRQKKFDILQWWMMHSTKYPVVSRMARDLLAAPASTVASESAFSTSGRIVSDYRSRLTSKKVQALVCLQDWLKTEGLSDVKLSEDDIGDGDDQDI